jgi:hypothetical protein
LLDALEFRAGLSAGELAASLRSGEIDLVRDLLPEDLDEILRDRRLKASLLEAPKKNTYYVLFSKSGALGTFLRRDRLCAESFAHDLVRATLGRFAQPAEGLIPAGILGADPGRRRYPIDREKAVPCWNRRACASHPAESIRSSHSSDRFGSLTQRFLRSGRISA